MEKRQQLFVLAASLLLSMQSGFGQQSQTLVWNTLQLPVQLSSKWQVHNDISYRTVGISASAYQYTFRTGMRRFINEKWNVATGLAFFFTRTSFEKANHEFGREFRLWQEVVKENKLNKKLSLFSRFRTEERFFAATSVKDKNFALRLRYRMAVVQTLSEKWRIQLANEYMRQVAGGEFAFQQNRLGATVIYSVNNTTQLQAGYIWSKLSAATQHFITCTFIKTIVANGVGNKK
jgi:Protein of unknown function (DUF2490)